jgi:hypothetical protein
MPEPGIILTRSMSQMNGNENDILKLNEQQDDETDERIDLVL